MIFVTLGTQDKPFNRLLEAVQKQDERGWIIVKPSYFTLNDLDDFLDWDNM